MNYQEVLNYLYAQLPMFQRIGAAAYKADLKNIQTLCKKMGHPEKKLKFIHIAGTNGKGSVSNMLAAIFQLNGYKTGLFTSPHLIDFRERIKVNGQMISKQYVTRFVNQYKSLFDEVKPSFFEWTTILAFQYFLDKKVDIVVLETGMGGRLDCTNVVTSELSIITNIGEDHKQFLGDTLQKIAHEKAGIIKPNIPVLISEYQKEVLNVFKTKSEESQAPLFYAKNIVKINSYKHTSQYLDLSYSIINTNLNKNLDKSKNISFNNQNNILEQFKNNFRYIKLLNLDKSKIREFKVKISLNSTYQIKNVKCVLAACELLQLMNWKLKRELIHKAIQDTPKITGFRGRWDIIQIKPYLILDIAHNKQGLQNTLQNLKRYQFQQLRIIFGVVNDKEIDEIIPLLPKKALYYVTQASVPRALPANALSEKLQSHHLNCNVFTPLHFAIQTALKEANPDDLILVTGSAFVVADALNYLKNKSSKK